MHAERAVVEGNPFLGLFARAGDKVALVGYSAPGRFIEKCERVLRVKAARVAVDGSNLAGLFCAVNGNGAVLSCLASREEARAVKDVGLNAGVMSGRLTAAANNILANDRAAIVNPAMSAGDVRVVRDCLGVEVVKRAVAGFPTVGSAGLVTNRGLLVHGEADEEELAELKGIFGVKNGAPGTANMGVPFVGLCLVANSHGYLAGEHTSGFEIARVDDALGFAGKNA